MIAGRLEGDAETRPDRLGTGFGASRIRFAWPSGTTNCATLAGRAARVMSLSSGGGTVRIVNDQ